MKNLPPPETSNPSPSTNKGKWRRLFKRRLARKNSQLTRAASEDLEPDFDKLSEATDDNRNNVNYFDFTFV